MQNEYDLGACGKDKIVIQSQNRFEQSAVPLCMMWYPPIYKEQFLCTANDSVCLHGSARLIVHCSLFSFTA